VSRYSQHNQNALVYAEAFYKAGKLDQARKIAAAIRKDVTEQKNYYEYLKAEKSEYYHGLGGVEAQFNELMGHVLEKIEEHYDPLRKKPGTPVLELEGARKSADSSKQHVSPK